MFLAKTRGNWHLLEVQKEIGGGGGTDSYSRIYVRMYVTRIGYKKKTKRVPRLWVSSTFALFCLEFPFLFLFFYFYFFACFILEMSE